jgi:hypothetical protein
MDGAALDMRGHNRPPVTEIFRMENEQLQTNLMFDNQDLLERRDALLASFARCPAECLDDEADKSFTTFKAQILACVSAADNKRKMDKAPVLEASKLIEGFYGTIIDPLNDAKNTVLQRLTSYKLKKEAAERRAREEAERKAREEAARIAQEAAAKAATLTSDKDLAEALTAEELARSAEATALQAGEAARAKSAELSRTRSDSGAVSSLRTEWKGEIVSKAELDLEALRPYLAPADLEKAMRGYIKAGGRTLKGARIYEHKFAR